MTGPLEMVGGDAPVCVDGVCLPVGINGAADLVESDLVESDLVESDLVEPAPVDAVAGPFATGQTPPTD